MSTDAEPDDAELLARSASGDAAAFARFTQRHAAAVFRHARSLCRNDADAEDVLQQTFLQAWRAAGGARVERVRPWLYTIARHALQRLRRRSASQVGDDVSLEQLGVAAGFADPRATPARLAAATEERAVLAAALDELAPPDREVIVLRDLEQLTGDETAAVLGLTLEAMKSRLHRARLRLCAEVRRRLPDGASP